MTKRSISNVVFIILLTLSWFLSWAPSDPFGSETNGTMIFFDLISEVELNIMEDL